MLEALAVMSWLGVIALAVACAAHCGEIRSLRAEIAVLRLKCELPALRQEADSWTERVERSARATGCAAHAAQDGTG